MKIHQIMANTDAVFPRDQREKNLKPGEVRAPDLPLELFEAYYSCRKNKRNSRSALDFEARFEREIWQLHKELVSRTYQPGRCIAFIVEEPVKREVFASCFRDRVVHHWLIDRLNPLFEKLFIHDSYACRPNKGNLFGIRRVASGMRTVCQETQWDGYVLKLDIRGFFMHINRNILYQKLENFIRSSYHQSDLDLVLYVTHKIVYHQPASNCDIRGSLSDWNGLPRDKSLFYAPNDCGLPIGNLSSQVFANFYLHTFDKFVTEELKVSHYGRYVDDFVLVHPDAAYLNLLVPQIEQFLRSELALTLHPKKRYMQHVSKGVTFLGAKIKPGRIEAAVRIKTQFYGAIHRINALLNQKKPLSKIQKLYVVCCIKSYLGLLRWYSTHRLRKKLLIQVLDPEWREQLSVRNRFRKVRYRKQGGNSKRTKSG
jgi:hypothetical protein